MIRIVPAAVAVAAVLAFAPAALAQTAPAEAGQAATGETPGPSEAQFEARAEAFGVRMQAMATEMQSAVAGAGGDAAKQDADLDAIEARYQAYADTFATELSAFVSAQAEAAPEEERAGMTAGIAGALPQIRAIPATVRSQVEQAAATAAAAPTGTPDTTP
ncbi:MAG: hypothetical protein KJ824_12330 [Alphaproteobacteria bacterium]|nr:hypothetical protein [Alphaproteobacteria bacterium]